MKRLICVLTLICVLFTSFSVIAEEEEMRGVWFSYEDYASSLKGLSSAEFDAKADEICKNIKSAGLNTVIFHVRAFSDAFYNSSYFGYSKYVTGEVGKAPDYDPLAKMCAVAHNNGLKIHAWINPYRIGSPQNVTSSSVAYAWKNTHGEERVCTLNGLWYYNPASQEVRDYIVEGVREICANYAVDGIHFDDYFYPTADESFDSSSYSKANTSLSLAQWRIENINLLIAKTYASIKEINPNIVFGISPNADIEKNYSTYFADVKKWMAEDGYVDYITPQIYFGYKNSTMAFDKVLKQWNELCTVPDLYIGLATYKAGKTDKWAGVGINEWIESTDMCARQILDLRANSKAGGFMLFCYSPIWGTDATVNAKAEILKITQLLNKSATPDITVMDAFINILKSLFNCN